jgi:hypothetical protein
MRRKTKEGKQNHFHCAAERSVALLVLKNIWNHLGDDHTGVIFHHSHGCTDFNTIDAVGRARHRSVQPTGANHGVVGIGHFKIKLCMTGVHPVMVIFFCMRIQLPDSFYALHALFVWKTGDEAFSFRIVQAEIVKTFFVSENGKFGKIHSCDVRGG